MIGNDFRAEKLKKEQVMEDYREPIYNRYADEEYPRTLGPQVSKQMTLGEHLDQQRALIEELDKCILALEERLSPVLMGHPVDTARDKEPVTNDSHLVLAVRSHNNYISSLIGRISYTRNNIQL